MNKFLKIVHCANFSENKYGNVYYSMDRKISHGLNQNGHLVYDFSYRDNEKVSRRFGIKNSGLKKMNSNLIEICRNLSPDVLLLSKAELINIETLKEIKNIKPTIKIIQWYVDFIKTEKKEFFDRFKYIDTFLQTTVCNLDELSKKYKETVFSYFPNISDPTFDKNTTKEKEYDILYIARDNKEDNRYKFAKLLNEFCKKENINLKMYGSLGNPLIFGSKYFEEISKAKIAINFNREDGLEDYNRLKILGTSDRMNHFLGAGACTFSPKIVDLEKLYIPNKDVVFFDNVTDSFKKIKYFLKDDNYKEIAESGQKKAYLISNAKRVSKYILELGTKESFSEDYEWKEYIFSRGN